MSETTIAVYQTELWEKELLQPEEFPNLVTGPAAQDALVKLFEKEEDSEAENLQLQLL